MEDSLVHGQSDEDHRSISPLSSLDSLFDELELDSLAAIPCIPPTVAERNAPAISGLYFDPKILLSTELHDTLLAACTSTFFPHASASSSSPSSAGNQVMLFGTSMFPPFMISLLPILEEHLRPFLPAKVHHMLFPSDSAEPKLERQAIVNRYAPGEGISPHIDLLGRYADGIIGVSLASGAVMTLCRETGDGCNDQQRHDLYLPVGSLIVLTGEARYEWTHGIEKRTKDLVVREGSGVWETEFLERGTRISITFRWLLPDALTVGGP
jgi:hypothetical protein